MTAVLWVLVGLPAAVGAVLLVSGRRADPAAAPCAVAATALTLVAAVIAAATRPSTSVPMLQGVPARLAVDGLSAVAVITVAAVATAVVLFASADMGEGEARGRFFGLMLLFTGAMLVTVTATDLLTLLMAWEVMGALSYALIGYWWREAHRVRSATLAFLTTRTADLGLYLAAGAALAGGAEALQLSALASLEDGWRDAAVAGVIVAALGKSAQLPFSFWLSHAMAGPSPVSALLHSATMVAAGGYLLVRTAPAIAATGSAGPFLAWTGAVTAILLGAVALTQSDLKQLLAASTCSQIGFIVLAAGVGGIAGGALQFTAHAAAKSLLFLCAGAWLASSGTQDLGRLRGAARRRPLVGAVFTVGAMAIAGLPPLGIWVAKDEVLAAALAASPALYAAGLVAAAVSAAYAAKALALVWTVDSSPEEGRPEGDHSVTASASPSERSALLALAVAAAGLGMFALPPLARWWRTLLGAAGEPEPSMWEMAVSGLLSTAVVVGVWLVYARGATRVTAGALPGRQWLGDWLGLERLVDNGVVRPTMALARSLAAFDDRVVAGGVGAAARSAAALSRGLAVFDDRSVAGGVRAVAELGVSTAEAARTRVEIAVDRAVGAVAAGARSAASWALRPQTGLVHQYYAQAVVALAVLAALFLLVR
ncbi:proton-conducting transporter transmembrane domain-containing protein [Nocardiopsis metallicus]|uniref:NADH:ubiquinone oxidoreductase subunit 5 (Subunit L)/multisubunit Na+/H+ antiporter MnhA subunit n=1 Tax=Nocardiopsis metallicus TaxID=179819 RepID=A0A840WC11_9ACTN|nr:proton-conducting transporter membrane subunit [Nocardiopsis metallicus]MBB5494529.1 NADH:ubiquinone oxidoreductase subunit 5 (subunit L)/multisubunit Na+/H+ antiporter MnhA subunit [Nocardiopsis metallicus]